MCPAGFKVVHYIIIFIHTANCQHRLKTIIIIIIIIIIITTTTTTTTNTTIACVVYCREIAGVLC